MDDKAAGAICNVECDGCGVICFTKDDMGDAGTAFSIGISAIGTDDQIGEAIGVDVTSRLTDQPLLS